MTINIFKYERGSGSVLTIPDEITDIHTNVMSEVNMPFIIFTIKCEMVKLSFFIKKPPNIYDI